ncbi:MAG: chemotaxis protein CheW [Pirellulales bacterium]
MTTIGNDDRLNHPIDDGMLVDDCWNKIGIKGDRSCPELSKVGHCHNCAVFSAAGERLFMRPLPADCLSEHPGHEQVLESSGAQERAVFVFRLAEEWYALDVRSMVEVAEPRKVHRVPHRRAALLRGLVNVRGELQLCVSATELLNITVEGERRTSADTTGWLLMIENQHGRWALEVDEIAGVQRVMAQQLGGVPVTVAHSKNPSSQHVFVDGDRRIGLLDSTKLFASIEQGNW